MLFSAVVAAVAFLAGAIASVAGFGIGSLLTPLVATHYGMKLAVAAVSVPHVVATVVRFVRLRRHLDRGVLLRFGLINAAGALVGAIGHGFLTSPILGRVLAILLIFAGALGIFGMADRMRFGRRTAWVAGAVSGAFGGLVGNQGGLRAAAMLGLGVQKEAFVATATAIGLLVDAVRMPIYFATGGGAVLSVWQVVLVALVAVVAGTLAGERLLRRVPQPIFRRIVGAVLLAIGIFLLVAQD